MLAHDRDATRFLYRVEHRGLLTRERPLRDRRMVTARITPLLASVLPVYPSSFRLHHFPSPLLFCPLYCPTRR